MFKSLFVIATFVTLSHAVFAGELVCLNIKGNAYPNNDLARQLTKKEGVKTCNKSELFQAKIKAAGHTVKIVDATEEQKAAYYAAIVKSGK